MRFVVSTQSWLKALIVLATIAFAALALFLVGAGIKTNQVIAWITVIAVTCGATWLVAVGIDHMRFFSVELRVEEDQVTVLSAGRQQIYPVAELNLRTRPIANAIELRHKSDGKLFVADMYATNASRLIELFERGAAR
jgi:hypothetical protein